jgi:hypothetical protein
VTAGGEAGEIAHEGDQGAYAEDAHSRDGAQALDRILVGGERLELALGGAQPLLQGLDLERSFEQRPGKRPTDPILTRGAQAG